MKLLTWSDLPNGQRFEVLDARSAYGTPAPFLVRFTQAGVTINDHPHQTEVGARTAFERLVEEHTEL